MLVLNFFLILLKLAFYALSYRNETQVPGNDESAIIKKTAKIRNNREKEVLCQLVNSLLHSRLPTTNLRQCKKVEYTLNVPEGPGDPKCSDFIQSLIRDVRLPPEKHIQSVQYRIVDAQISPYNCSTGSQLQAAINITERSPPPGIIRELGSILRSQVQNKGQSFHVYLDRLAQRLKEKRFTMRELHKHV